MSAEKAAAIIIRGMEKQDGNSLSISSLFTKASQFLPDRLYTSPYTHPKTVNDEKS